MATQTPLTRYSDDREGLNRTNSHSSSFDSDTNDERSFLRRTTSRRRQTWYSGYLDRAKEFQSFATEKFHELTPIQKVLVSLGVVIFGVLGLVFLIYHSAILARLDQWGRQWRSVKGGWLLLWFATFITAFPPLFGYSNFLTTTGFIYGFPNGWFISATATVAGSFCSFVVSRRVLLGYVQRIARKDERFELFSKVLHDGDFKLLCLIRLCPLPYSLSNGAIATLTKISLKNFTLATAVITPKLLMHTFVGSQIAAIGDSESPSSSSKFVHYFALVFALGIGIFTARYVYNKAKAIAANAEMHEDELEDGLDGQTRTETSPQYSDDIDDPPKQSLPSERYEGNGSTR